MAKPPVASSIPASTQTITTSVQCTAQASAKRTRAWGATQSGMAPLTQMHHPVASRATASSQQARTNQQRTRTKQRITLILCRTITSPPRILETLSTRRASQAKPTPPIQSPTRKRSSRCPRVQQCQREGPFRKLGFSCSIERILKTQL
jgi:hypothetical protein